MPRYLIERDIEGAGLMTPAELKAVSQTSCRGGVRVNRRNRKDIPNAVSVSRARVVGGLHRNVGKLQGMQMSPPTSKPAA